MTKSKNTKKGMAKKTLSMSLVVAMLATSNVPVWAAEFSDGSDATELTTEVPTAEDNNTEAEAFTDEATPVAEDTTAEAATSDPTVDSKYVVEFKNLPSSMTWNEEKEVEIRVFDKVQDKYVTNNTDIQVRYLDEDGQLVGNNGNAIAFTTAAPTEDGYAKFKINFLPWVKADKTLVGKKFRLQVFNTKDPNETGYANASNPIEVKKVKTNGTVNIMGNSAYADKWNKVVYTGKAITTGPELVKGTGLWEVTVNKRDLTNAATTEIRFKPVNNETLINGAFINADALKNGNLVIKDVKTGADLTAALKDKVKVTLTSNPLAVKTGSSYTATVEAVDTDSLSGKRDVTFKVIAHDLSKATVKKEADLKTRTKYTGSQITKNITKDNFESKLGVVTYQYSAGQDTPLAKDKEYSSTPEFGENLNVGKGQIIINGLGTFEDTQKVIEFEITARDADTLNVPKSVDYNEAYTTAADYNLASQTTVTSTFKDEWTGEIKTLTVPASDYTIAYSYEDENHQAVAGPVKGGYIVTTVSPKANVNSNFTFTSFTEKTKLAKKAIKEEDVTLNKDSYVYC